MRLDVLKVTSESKTLQRRHNGRDGVSNHQRLDCLRNRFSGADQRKHQSSLSLTFVRIPLTMGQ